MSAGGAQSRWVDRVLDLLIGCLMVSSGCKNCLSCASLSKSGFPYGCVHRSQVKNWRRRVLSFKPASLVLVCSTSDMFLTQAMDWWEEMRDLLLLRLDVTFLALTKRLDNAKLFTDKFGPLPNLLLGTSVENQRTLDGRVPLLYSIPAAGYVISVQPMLGPVDLSRYLNHKGLVKVVAGAEMGKHPRPCDVAWIRKVEAQCVAHGVPHFLGQYRDECGEMVKPPTQSGRPSHAPGRTSYGKGEPKNLIGMDVILRIANTKAA